MNLPRLMLAGLGGGSGKTTLSLGLISALRKRGLSIAPYKKGPDYIDPSWLGHAAGKVCRNLDGFLFDPSVIVQSLGRALGCDLALIEGNRGLFDGVDGLGTHSSAALALSTSTPVVLVLDAGKSTRSHLATVLGCLSLEPSLRIGGILLNRVRTLRQEKVIRESFASFLRAPLPPLLGALPVWAGTDNGRVLPERHLGLVPIAESGFGHVSATLDFFADQMAKHCDISSLLALSQSAPPLPDVGTVLPKAPAAGIQKKRIGVVRDEAFSFYYPENLEALAAAGAELVFFSALHDAEMPAVDGLYVGGGFPEEHLRALVANQSLRNQVRKLVSAGLPVYAECGGLMWLSRAIYRDGIRHEMVGALDLEVEHCAAPIGHGYVRGEIVGDSSYFALGKEFRGHEFHHSRPIQVSASVLMHLSKGTGLGKARDGLGGGKLWSSYSHLHALSDPHWAQRFVSALT